MLEGRDLATLEPNNFTLSILLSQGALMVSVGFVSFISLHASKFTSSTFVHTSRYSKPLCPTPALICASLQQHEPPTKVNAATPKRPRVDVPPSIVRRKPSALQIVQRAKQSLTQIQSRLFYLPSQISGDGEEVFAQTCHLIQLLLAIHTSVKDVPFVSLPSVSKLEAVLRLSHQNESDKNICPLVRQLLHPAGTLSRACVSTRRALQVAEWSLTLGFHPVGGTPPPGVCEQFPDWEESLRSIQAKITQLVRSRIVGKSWLRNPWWGAIPYRFMRTHDDTIPAPPLSNVSISSLSDLRDLRQDSRAFLSATRSVTLSVRTLLGLLGLSTRLSERIERRQSPRTSRPCAVVMSAWTEIMRKTQNLSDSSARSDSKPSAVWSFEDLFHTYHVPNALLVYVSELGQQWKSSSGVRKAACSGVRIRETGLFVTKLGGVDFCAAPAALMSQRVSEDFWMWGSETCAVVVNIDSSFVPLREQLPYSMNSGSQPWFKHSVPLTRRQLDVASWIQAQAVMHACGSSVNKVHVVRYSVYGGTRIHEVTRNEEFIEKLSQFVKKFFEKFVHTGVPPTASFQKEHPDDQSLLTTASLQCKLARELAVISGDVSELILSSFRRNMNQWEIDRAKAIFNEFSSKDMEAS